MGKLDTRLLKMRSCAHGSRSVDLSDLTIGVLYGGVSSERSVSLVSGEEVASALVRDGLTVTPIDVNETFTPDMLRFHKLDVAFLALHGGDGENGEIQAQLDRLGIAYQGSGPYASRIAMDKPWTKRLLKADRKSVG